MAEIDPVILELRAELRQYNNQVRATTTIVDRSLQQQERRVISLERQIERSSGAISGKLRLLAGTFAGAFSAREIGSLVDGFTRLQNSLRVTGLEGEALANVQERLRQIGATYGVEIEALGSVFNRASLAQKELGASTEQIIRLNEIIAAGLKITGTSSQEASGALLQLGQALGSGVVRAEEFNSVLEGALPIAQAAARGIEGFDGSVSKLRAAIADGQITSRQFFDGVLKGGVDTIKQAESATLTLGGALTVLRNELTLYVGEASKSNGATAALAQGIQTLAANLDTLANVIAIVGTALLGRYVAGLIASARASIALTAATAGTTTALGTLGAAATASRTALLAAFGGPVGLAITGVALALGYAVTQADEFERAQIAQAKGAARATDASKDAQRAIDQLAVATGDARTEALAFANAQREVQGQLLKTAAAAVVAAQAQRRAAEAEGPQSSLGLVGDVARTVLNRNNVAARGERRIAADNAENEAYGAFKRFADIYRNLSSSIDNGPPVAGGTPGKPDKATKTRAARDNTQRNLDRFDDDLLRLQAQELQLKAEITTDVGERAEFERQLIALAQEEYNAEIARRVRDGDLTEQQAQRLRIGNRFNSLLQEDLVERERQNRELDKRDAALRDEIRTAEASADLLTNRQERLAAEKRILALIEQEERNALERAIADGQVLDAARARANLAQQQAARQSGTDRQFESPLQRYRREASEFGNNINDAVEAVAVDGLDALNDGIVDAITGAKSLGDAFGNVANQIVKDLLRIAIQRQVIGPLADSLFGAEGGGGGLLRSIFGRASGGYVGPGQMVRINEGASGGRVEGWQPNGGGRVIPLGRMNAMPSGGNTVVQQTFVLDARGGVTTTQLIEQMNGLARQAAIEGAQGGRALAARDMGKMNRPRI